MNESSNTNIKCTVESCKYHNCNDYCSLEDITVGTDCKNPQSKCETECLSFECGCNHQ